MDADLTEQVAIAGLGLAGCGVVTILKGSFSSMPSAPAFLIAVGDDEEALSVAMADKKIMARPGERLEIDVDLDRFAVAFFVLEPSDGQALTWAQALASEASGTNAYTFGLLIKPSGGWPEDEKTIYGSFDGCAVVDEGWVLELRKGKDPEYAMRIVFNFVAHALTFMADAIKDGKLGMEALRKATYGKVGAFAATSTSQADTLYHMTMSRIDRPGVSSAILFMPEDTDNVTARRIFLGVAAGLPRSIEMIALRVKYVEPFRIVALLMS
jgi:hypothetical protein